MCFFFVTFHFPPTFTSAIALPLCLPHLSTGTEVKSTEELTSTSPSVTEASKQQQTTGEHIQCTVYVRPFYVSKSVCECCLSFNTEGVLCILCTSPMCACVCVCLSSSFSSPTSAPCLYRCRGQRCRRGNSYL